MATEAPQKSPGEGHIPVLDGVRGVAIAMVLVFHFWQGAGVYQLPARAASLLRVASIGQKGVDLFFVLSGFLITGILMRSKGSPRYFRNFYARRALRIFPLYFGVVLACLLAGRLFSLPLYQWHNTWWYLLYLQNVADTFWPNAIRGPGHFWSLAVEEHYYLFWPLLVSLLGRRALAFCCLGLMLAAPLIRAVFVAEGLSSFSFTLCRMDTLALGALLAVAFDAAEPWARVVRWTRRLVLPVGAAALATFFVLSGSGNPEVQAIKYSLFAVLCAFVLVLALAPAPGNPLPAWFSARLLREVGKTSYAMYVFHPFIYAQVMGRFYEGPWSPVYHRPWPALLLELVVGVGLTIWASRVSWLLFEQPLLRLKRRFEYAAQPTKNAVI